LAGDNEEVKYEESIGKSIEGRDQPAVEITAAVTDVNIIYFQCQIHASKLAALRTCPLNKVTGIFFIQTLARLHYRLFLS